MVFCCASKNAVIEGTYIKIANISNKNKNNENKTIIIKDISCFVSDNIEINDNLPKITKTSLTIVNQKIKRDTNSNIDIVTNVSNNENTTILLK